MGLLVVDVVWQVLTSFLNSPSNFTDELARFLLIWVGVLGIAYVSGKNHHLSLDLLPKKWSEETYIRLNRFTYLLVIMFALLVMVIGGIRLVYVTYVLDQTSPALQIPFGIVYLVIPLSGLLIIFYKLHDIIYPKHD